MASPSTEPSPPSCRVSVGRAAAPWGASTALHVALTPTPVLDPGPRLTPGVDPLSPPVPCRASPS